MVDFSAMAGGFRKSMEDDRATRKDVANTFAQFRKDNPFATLQDMQDQINILSGGRNFLRAGLPSTAVLSGIAQSNLDAKKQKDLETNFSNYSKRAEIQEDLRTKAMNFLTQKMQSQQFLGASKELQNSFLNGLETEFLSNLKESLGTDLDMDMSKTIANVFSIENATKARDDIFTKNMPEVQSLILDKLKAKRNLGEELKLSDNEVTLISNQTLIPKWKIKETFETVNADYNMKMIEESDAFLSNQSQIVNDFMQKYQQDWISGTKTGDQIKKEAKDYLIQQAKDRKLPLSDDKIAILVEGNYSKLLSVWESESKEKKKRDKNELQTIANAIKAQVLTNIQTEGTVAYKAFKQAGEAGLVKLAEEILARQYDDDYLNEVFGEGTSERYKGQILAEIKTVLGETIGAMAENQQNNYAQFEAQQSQSVVNKIAEEKKTSKALADTYFGEKMGKYINTKMEDGTLAGGNMVLAIENMADTYYMDRNTMNVLAQAIQGYTPQNVPPSVAELESYFTSVLGTNLIRWDQRKKAVENSLIGSIPKIQKYSEWENGFSQSFDFAFDSITNNISELENIINNNQVDETTLAKLNAINNQINQTQSEITNAINTAGKNQTIWVKDGQPDIWDWNKANALGQSLYDKMATLREQVKELKGNPNVTNFSPLPQNTVQFDDTVQSIIDKIGNTQGFSADNAKAEVVKLINDRAQSFYKLLKDQGYTSHTNYYPVFGFGLGGGMSGGDAGGYQGFINPNIDISILGQIDEYLKDKNNLIRLTQDERNMKEFLDNPVKFMEKDIGSIPSILDSKLLNPK